MNKNVEILIELNNQRYYLDYDALDGIRLNYNINRIQDLQSLDSSYSLSIKLVNSKNNQNVLGFISNLNVVNGTFDPNKRTRAYILVDSIIVFEGFLQLLSIEYDDNKSINYQSVIYADNSNLYTSIENKFLQDLDFSRFNYTFDGDLFLTTATSSCDRDAIIFPLIDYGANWQYNQISGTGSNLGITSSQIDLNELYPATYVKTIVDQIFTDAGYKYESEFLNSPHFKKLVIPFTNEEMVNGTIITSDDSLLYSSSTASVFTQSSLVNTNISYNISYDTSDINSTANTRFNVSTQEYSNGLNRRYERFGVDIDLTILLGAYYITKVFPPFNDPTRDAFFSFFNKETEISLSFRRQYNAITNTLDTNPDNEFFRKIIYSSESSKVFYEEGTIVNSVQTLSERAYSGNSPLNPTSTIYRVLDNRLKLERNGFNVFSVGGTSLGVKEIFQDMGRLTSNETIWCPWLDGSIPDWLPLFPNEKIEILINIRYGTDANPRLYYPNQNIIINAAGSYPVRTSYGQPFLFQGIGVLNSNGWTRDTSLTYNNRIKNQVTKQVAIGTDLPVALNLPENVKQIDFLKSIIKMFNLYIEPIKGKINTFKIETRDDYYSNSKVKDWSSKVDLDKLVISDILSNTQAKETILKYTDDDDYFNDLYKKSFNETYGEYKYIINNEFVVGQNVVELIFSPTVLRSVYFADDIIISSIQKNSEYNQVPKTGNNIRILYCNILNLPNNKTISIDGKVYSNYIYAGHLDNPYNPDLDLSFNLPKKLYYDFIINGERKLTYNGLYNEYHRNQFSELNNTDSRLVKVHLQLNELDIYDFNFSDTIYLYVNENVNGYFRVNSINEFDPINVGSVMVELIKIDFTPSQQLISDTRFDTNRIIPNSLNLGSLNQFDNPAIVVGRRNIIKGVGNEVSGFNNLVIGNNVKVKGDGNTIVGDSINLNGSLNNISGSKVDINGSQNTSEASIVSAKITGDFNKINQQVENLQIQGSSNQIGEFGLTNSIASITSFGNNNIINFQNGMVVGNDNIATQSDINNVFFFGNSTTIDERYSNRLVVADDLTINAKKIVSDGLDNIVNAENALIYGNQNIVGTASEFNFIVGLSNSISGTSSFNQVLGSGNNIFENSNGNLVFGNNNIVGPKMQNSFIMGQNNEINKIGGLTLSNVFIMSNSETIYNLVDNIHLIDLQEGNFFARQKTGAPTRNDPFPDVSSYNLVQYVSDDNTYIRSTSIGTQVPVGITNSVSYIVSQLFINDNTNQQGVQEVKFFDYKLYNSSTSSTTQTNTIFTSDDFGSKFLTRDLVVFDIDTIINQKGAGVSQSYFHRKDTLYVRSPSTLQTPQIIHSTSNTISNLTSGSTYSVDYKFTTLSGVFNFTFDRDINYISDVNSDILTTFIIKSNFVTF